MHSSPDSLLLYAARAMNHHNDELSQSSFPRQYRLDASMLYFFNGFPIFLVALFGVMTVLHLRGFMARPLAPFDLALMDSLVALFAIWGISWVNRRIILFEDAIQVSGWWSNRRLSREEIQGYRIGNLPIQYGGSSYYIIVPVDSKKSDLRLPPFLQTDSTFHSWIKSIPHLTTKSSSS
jgi:hypothetical protein